MDSKFGGRQTVRSEQSWWCLKDLMATFFNLLNNNNKVVNLLLTNNPDYGIEIKKENSEYLKWYKC